MQYDFNALFLKSTRWIEKISAFVHCFHLLVFSLIISVPFASEFPEPGDISYFPLQFQAGFSYACFCNLCSYLCLYYYLIFNLNNFLGADEHYWSSQFCSPAHLYHNTSVSLYYALALIMKPICHTHYLHITALLLILFLPG